MKWKISAIDILATGTFTTNTPIADISAISTAVVASPAL